MLKKQYLFLSVVVGAVSLAIILAVTHPSASAVVSFDEGFHGGAVLFVRAMLLTVLGLHEGLRPTYLAPEFINGLTWYPPLWTIVAAAFSAVFGPSVGVLRAATSLFYIATIVWSYWFVSTSRKSQKAGIISALIIATVPLVMIYSHLMMLEVPLLFGVTSMITFFYLYAMDLVPRNWKIVLVGMAIFILGSWAKLAGIGVVVAVCGLFMLVSSVAYFKQRFYRHFLKPELLLFFIASVAGVAAFVFLEVHAFDRNIITFHLSQTESLSGPKSANPLIGLIQLAWSHREFYLRDFRHMSLLTNIWFGSVAFYLIWKRTPLALLVALWAACTYFIFSGVEPQVPQYIMPIYAPLAIASALMISDLTDLFKNRFLRLGSAGVLSIGLAATQIMAMPLSEGYQWRADGSGQIQAAQYINQHAALHDRVLLWHDGTAFSLRSEAGSKELQLRNAINQVCPAALIDSYEWAVNTERQVPQPSSLDMAALTGPDWEVAASFNDDQKTTVYHNKSVAWPLKVEAETMSGIENIRADSSAQGGKAVLVSGLKSQPDFWGCYRVLPLGNYNASFYLKAGSIPTYLADSDEVLKLEFTGYPGGDFSSRMITAGELRASTNYQAFELPLERRRLNLQGEFRITVLKPLELLLDRFEVGK